MTDALALRQSMESFRRLRVAGEQEAASERAAARDALAGLGATVKPHVPAYVFLGFIALILDLLDFLETPGDATVIVFIIQIIVELSFFFLVKAMVGRGALASWVLMLAVAVGIAFSVIPFFGTVVSAASGLVVLMAALMNRKAKVAQVSKSRVTEQLRSLDRKLVVAEQRVQRVAARARAMGRRAGRAARSARLSARTAKATRTVTKASRTTFRALRNTIANILPFVELIPFQLMTVIGTYRDQLREYREGQEMLAEYAQQVAALEEARAEELRLVAAVVGDTEEVRAALPRRPQARPAPVAHSQGPPGRVAPTVRDIGRPEAGGPIPIHPRRPEPVVRPAVPVRDIAFAT